MYYTSICIYTVILILYTSLEAHTVVVDCHDEACLAELLAPAAGI